MMSYNPAQKEWIGYLDPNIYHLPFPYPWRKDAMENPANYFRKNIDTLLKEKNLDPDKDFAGIIMETFQGWGAVCYPSEFVKEVEDFARKHDIVLAFDEMQAGFGRTGKLFGYMHYGVEPDLLACGKGASSGVPLSIVLGSKEIMDLPEIGSMSSTHSANPLVCVVGKANLQALIEDGLIEKARDQGKVFHEKLNELRNKYSHYLKYILGMGMVAGLVFQDDNGKPLVDLCNRISELAMRKGLLVVHTGRESIKLAPPLSIPTEALLEGIAVLDECIKECI
jgi:4-aminobutyrate aminotransferase-like enzyme